MSAELGQLRIRAYDGSAIVTEVFTTGANVVVLRTTDKRDVALGGGIPDTATNYLDEREARELFNWLGKYLHGVR